MVPTSGTGRLTHRRFLAIVVLASIALSLPAILAGYMGDDYFFLGGAFEPDAPFGYYNFTENNVATEIQQWWSSRDFKMSFFRPLASLSLHLDVTLWRSMPILAHLHSILWFVLLLVGGDRVFRAVLSARAARWALALFALSVVHAWGAGWIAARHAVMGGAFAVWAASAYLSWRSSGRAKLGFVSAGLFLLGLLSSEIALSFTGFAVSYEVLYSEEPRARRLRHAAPVLVIALAYVAFYKVAGFGTAGSDAYTDPFSQPAEFLRSLAPKTVALLGALLMGVPASLRMLPGMDAVSLGAGAIGIAALTAGIALCRRRFGSEERRTMKWLVLMGALTLFPGVAGIGQGREFMLFGLAVTGIASVTLTALFSPEPLLGKRLALRATGGLLVAGTLVLSPITRVGMGGIVYLHADLSRQLGLSETGCAEGSHVIVLTGDFEVPIAYAPHLVANHQGRFFESWNQLAVTKAAVTVSRPRADRIVLSSEAPLVDTMLLREGDDPLATGDVIERRPLRVEILKVSDDGPTEIAYTFKSRDVVDNLCPLETVKGVLTPAALPEVGESVELTYEPYFE